MDDKREPNGDIERRLWRLEERQGSLIAKITEIERKMDLASQQNVVFRLHLVERRLGLNDEKPSSPLFQQEGIIKTVIYMLLAVVVALAGGQFANFVGWFR